MKCSEVQWSEGDVNESDGNRSELTCNDDLVCNVYINIDVQLCGWLYVGFVYNIVSLLFASLCYFLITRFLFLIFFLCLLSVFCILCFCIVLCIVSPVYSCLFPLFLQAYRPLPPGGNQTAVNKISYIISYRMESYHIVSYRIIYHIIYTIPYIISYTQSLWISSHWAKLHCITYCGFTNCIQFTVDIFQNTTNCVATVNLSILAMSRFL